MSVISMKGNFGEYNHGSGCNYEGWIIYRRKLLWNLGSCPLSSPKLCPLECSLQSVNVIVSEICQGETVWYSFVSHIVSISSSKNLKQKPDDVSPVVALLKGKDTTCLLRVSFP